MLNRFKRSAWVGAVAIGGAELCWALLAVLVWIFGTGEHWSALLVVYCLHLLPLLVGARFSLPLVRTGDKRRWVHLLTVMAAADYFSLILGAAVAVTVPHWGVRVLAAAGIAVWLAVLWSFLTFLRGMAVSRTAVANSRVDAVVVLGCGLVGRSPGPMLARRLDRAVGLVSGSVPVVVSGGRGADEEISEAAAMADYLRGTHGVHLAERGVPVLEENQATNTRENLRLSVEALRAAGYPTENIAVVTSDFHVKRTEATAQMVAGLLGDGQGEGPVAGPADELMKPAKSGPARFQVFGAITPEAARPAAHLREFVAYSLWRIRSLS